MNERDISKNNGVLDGRLPPVAATGARRLYMGPYGKEDTPGLLFELW